MNVARLRVAVAFALTVAAIAASTAFAQPTARTGATSCDQKVTVIGVRGSGDPQAGDTLTDKYGDSVHGMGKPGAALAVALANKLPRGEVSFLPIVYPAVGLLDNWRQIINAAGAGLHIGFLGAYTGSVKDGTAALHKTIDDEERICGSSEKLVLVGYSQGAQVVGDVYERDLTSAARKQVAGVVVFGDPYFNPRDSAADRKGFDPIRHGALGTRPLYPTGAPVFSVCHDRDPICQGAGPVSFSQHTNYQNDAWVGKAAAFIAGKVVPPPTAPPPTFIGNWQGTYTAMSTVPDCDNNGIFDESGSVTMQVSANGSSFTATLSLPDFIMNWGAPSGRNCEITGRTGDTIAATLALSGPSTLTGTTATGSGEGTPTGSSLVLTLNGNSITGVLTGPPSGRTKTTQLTFQRSP